MTEELSDVGYLKSLVRPLVACPDEVSVERTTDERGVLLTLHVNKEDMGKVIGKEGTTASALRKLTRQFGMKNQSRVSIRIHEPTI